MAYRPTRLPGARRVRPLRIDPLEERALLSVDGLKSSTMANFDYGLTAVKREYDAWLNSTPPLGSQFQASDPYVQTYGNMVAITAVTAGDPQVLRNQLQSIGLQRTAALQSAVSGLLPLSQLDNLAQLSSVAFAKAAYAPYTNVGSVTSQADIVSNGIDARTEFGVDGTGVKVGVISDTFNHQNGAVIDFMTGDLPPLHEIDIVRDESFFAGFNSDEGRGMMQLIHDVAPGATLAFRDAGFSQIDFANGIRQLAYEAQSDIIVDDIGFFDAPFFQDGFIAQAVDEVVGTGVAYFSSAGNDGNSSYEAPFQPSFFLPTGELDSEDDAPFFWGGRMHGRVFPILDMPENAFIHIGMQWDQPYFSVSPGSGGSLNDYDIYLFSDDFDPIELDGTVVAGSTTDNFGGDPIERFAFLNEDDGADYFLVIVKYFEPLPLNFASTNVPLPIPDNGATATSSLTVPQGGLPVFTQITDLNVQLNIEHPAVGELTVSLVSPNGTVVELVADTGDTGSNFFNTIFDDEAAIGIGDGNAPFPGRYQPTGNLEDFDGQSPFGTWQLQVTDNEGGNAGTLISWSLEITTDVDPTPDADLIKLINFTGSGSMPIFGINGNSTIYGHANAAGAQAVGAVFYGNSPGFGNPVVNESFSSWGGTPILFDTDGNRLAQPDVRMKPEFSAPDGTNTTFFPGPMFGVGHLDTDVEPDGFPNFFGTSAASPHAAAVAALMLEALPTATPAEIYDALQQSTYDMETPGFDFISGHGFILADRAIATLTMGTRGSIGGTVFNDANGDGVQDPGENGIANRIVFIDINRNGQREEIEQRFATINEDLEIVDALPGDPNDPNATSDPTTITGRLLVSGVPTSVLNNLVVELDLSHTSVGDLDIVLVSPLGTRVKLIENRGDNRSHLRNTIFDDSAATSIVDGAPPYTGSFRPEEPLSVLLNDDPNGFWLLEVTDSVEFNKGTLHDWSINLTYDEPSVVTDANGDYQFNDLPFAAYAIRQEIPSGFEQTAPSSRAENPLLITEVDIGPVDKFEIQHTGGGATPLDTRGWFVAVSDAPFSDINAVNPVIWELPDEILPGQVLYRTDSPGDEFFGSGIFWNSNNTRIGSGWVMIVDADGNVVDWVGWGWTVADIANFNVTINGVTIDSLQGAWSGNGAPRTGSALFGGSVSSLQRIGSFDTNTATDFVWFDNPNIGETNTLAGLQLPVESRGLGAAQRVNFQNLVTNDLNFGTRAAAAAQNPPQQNQQPPANQGEPPQDNNNNNNNPPPAAGSGDQSKQSQPKRASVGLFDAATSMFFLRDDLAAGPADNWFSFGPAGSNWKPLAGDWDGNGSVTVGLYDADTGTFYLKNTNISGPADIVFRFGPGGADWTPLVGDWNGDGIETVGLYSGETFFLRDAHAAGPADAVFSFGPAHNGWSPITGDWNNDGRDSVGFYTGQSFFLRNSHAGGMADESFTFGPDGAGWTPLAGDWNGDGQVTVGLYSGELTCPQFLVQGL